MHSSNKTELDAEKYLDMFLITVISSTKILTYEISWIKNSFRIFLKSFFLTLFYRDFNFSKKRCLNTCDLPLYRTAGLLIQRLVAP